MSEVIVKIGEKNYWKDSKGGLTPEENIKPIDKTRHELVEELVMEAEKVGQIIKAFKTKAFKDTKAFIDLSAEQYGVLLGGRKGNTTLYNHDNSLKIQIAISENLVFDERIQAAKALIDECLKEWTDGSRNEVKTLINGAFDVDKEGNLNTNRILALRRLDITDSRWLRAMDAISESIQVVGSKSYIRFYKKAGNSDFWEPISLDIASV